MKCRNASEGEESEYSQGGADWSVCDFLLRCIHFTIIL